MRNEKVFNDKVLNLPSAIYDFQKFMNNHMEYSSSIYKVGYPKDIVN